MNGYKTYLTVNIFITEILLTTDIPNVRPYFKEE